MSHNAPAEVVMIVHTAMIRLGMMKPCNVCFSVLLHKTEGQLSYKLVFSRKDQIKIFYPVSQTL